MIMEYQIKFGTYDNDEQINQLKQLLYSSFGDKAGKFTTEYIKWQYINNPQGKVVSFNAWTIPEDIHVEPDLVAHYATIPITMVLGGKKEKGLLSLNTATNPNHQGKGLFTKLATETYNYAKKNGYRFVVGVANANSTHGFLKKLGFYLVSPLEVKVGIGSPYKKIDITNKNRVFYDNDILKWRLSCPQFDYVFSQNAILGNRKEPFFKTCISPILDGIEPEKVGVNYGNSMFKLYVGLGLNLGGMFMELPKFIKRSPFNLIFRDLTDAGELPVLTKDNVIFTLMDYDVA